MLFWGLLLSLRFRLTVILQKDMRIYLRVLGFIKMPIVPTKEKKIKLSSYSRRAMQKKKKKGEKKAEKKAERKSDGGAGASHELKEMTLSDKIKLIVDIFRTFTKSMFKHLRLEISHIYISLGTPDAAKTALLYGAVSQSVAYLLQFLSTLEHVSEPDIEDVTVFPNWTDEKTTVDVKITLSLRLWNIFDIVNHVIACLIKNLMKKNKKTKPLSENRAGRTKSMDTCASEKH